MSDGHDATRAHEAPLSGPTLRVKALESLLVDKGLVESPGARRADRHGGSTGVRDPVKLYGRSS